MKINSTFFVSAAIVAMIPFTSFTGSPVENETSKTQIFTAPDTSDVRRVVINDQYSLEIPKHMKVSKELNDEASLQYQNLEEELYIIVIDEPSNEFATAYKNEKGWDPNLTIAENYRRVQIAAMKKKMKMKGKPIIQKTKASSIPMEIVDFTGIVQGISFPIFYKVGFLEADKNVYMIMSWTLAERKGLHNSTMNEMLKSFRSEN